MKKSTKFIILGLILLSVSLLATRSGYALREGSGLPMPSVPGYGGMLPEPEPVTLIGLSIGAAGLAIKKKFFNRKK